MKRYRARPPCDPQCVVPAARGGVKGGTTTIPSFWGHKVAYMSCTLALTFRIYGQGVTADLPACDKKLHVSRAAPLP